MSKEQKSKTEYSFIDVSLQRCDTICNSITKVLNEIIENNNDIDNDLELDYAITTLRLIRYSFENEINIYKFVKSIELNFTSISNEYNIHTYYYNEILKDLKTLYGHGHVECNVFNFHSKVRNYLKCMKEMMHRLKK